MRPVFRFMSFTYDPATTVGQVRLSIADTVDEGHIFEDAEISAFLGLSSQSVAYAAARALRTIGASRALMARKLKVLDVELDTTTAAAQFINLAKSLEQSEENAGGFAIAEFAEGVFGRAERMMKERQRRGTL